MIRDGYDFVSNDFIQEYLITPDDGQCSLCQKPGPIVHIKNTAWDHPEYLLDMCEQCLRQIAESFKEGIEP